MAKKKRQIKKNFFKEQYKLSWNFLKECKIFICVALVVFFAFGLIGFFVPVPEELAKQLIEIIREILERTQGLSQFEMIQFIFLNNLQSSFFGFILGIFFGIAPVLFSLFNGYLLGFVASGSVGCAGYSSLLKLVPHGIFELPAVFISLGLGMKLGTFIFMKKKFASLKEYLLNGLRVLLFVVVPLLLIAAIIEGSLVILLR